AQLTRRSQVADVADVQEVEAAVREDDALALGPKTIGHLHSFVERHSPRRLVARPSVISLASAGGAPAPRRLVARPSLIRQALVEAPRARRLRCRASSRRRRPRRSPATPPR